MSEVPFPEERQGLRERMGGVVILMVILLVGAVAVYLAILMMGGFFSGLPSTANLPTSAQSAMSATISDFWLAIYVTIGGIFVVGGYGIIKLIFGY